MRSSVIFLLSVGLLCIFQVSTADEEPAGETPPEPAGGSPLMVTTTAVEDEVEEKSYDDTPKLKATTTFASAKISGDLTISLVLNKYGAVPRLWSTIFEKDAVADATFTIKMVEYWYYGEGVSCASLVSEDIPHQDIVVSSPLPASKPSEAQELTMNIQVNMTGGATVWDKVFVVVHDADGDATCAFPKVMPTKNVKAMEWSFTCVDDPTWDDFADAMEKAQIRLSLIQPIPVAPREWFTSDKRGCCHSKLLFLDTPTEADLEKINKAASDENGFGRYSVSEVCSVNLMDTFLWDRIKKFGKKMETPKPQVVTCSGSSSAAWAKWKTAFDEWNQMFGNYKYGFGSQQSYDKPYDERVPSSDRGCATQPKDALDKLVYGLGLITSEETSGRKQEAIQSLLDAVKDLKDGEDMRVVAGKIISVLFERNEWIRKPAEAKSVVKEILCRITKGTSKAQSMEMIADLVKEMREDSRVDLDTVLDRMIRRTITYLTSKYKFSDMVKKVFGEKPLDDRKMVSVLRQKFVRGLGLSGADEAFIHFTVEIYGDYIKEKGKELNATIQAYKKFTDLTSQSQHILKAVSNLTGINIEPVVNELIKIIKYPDSVDKVSFYLKHMIEDLIKFDEGGEFSEDLQRMLGPDAEKPISGLPLRLMLYVIQPYSEECNFDELLAYLPYMPEDEAPKDGGYYEEPMTYGGYEGYGGYGGGYSQQQGGYGGGQYGGQQGYGYNGGYGQTGPSGRQPYNGGGYGGYPRQAGPWAGNQQYGRQGQRWGGRW